MFDTDSIPELFFFEKIDFEKNQQTTKKHEKLPSSQRVNTWASPITVFNLISILYSIPSLKNSVDSDQLASHEAS